jgi:hypothetical protein
VLWAVGSDIVVSLSFRRAKSRSARLIGTGLRPTVCAVFASSRYSPPVWAASASAQLGGVTVSSSPSSTSTGQRIRPAMSTNASRPAMNTSRIDPAPICSTGPSVWAIVSPSVSSPQSIACSIAIVEWGSATTSPIHHSRNSG